MTSLYFEFFSVKPSYRIVFPFGAVGAFGYVCDNNHNGTKFKSQCLLNITLGQSEYTNRIII